MHRLVRLLLLLTAASALAQPPRTVQNFNNDWRFLQADTSGAEQPLFDDSAWHRLNLPHDWAIEGQFNARAPEGQGGAFLRTGTGWYRKRFNLPATDEHRHIFVVFDGVMANSDVWINGFHLGSRPNGYVSFFYELTGHLQFGTGGSNVLAVRADNASQPASRWHAGAGIYRSVRLVTTSDVHIAPWGTSVTTPDVSIAQAKLHVRSTISNESPTPARVLLDVDVFGPGLTILKRLTSPVTTVRANGSVAIEVEATIPRPDRWDIDHPALYTARSSLLRTGATRNQSEQVDAEEVRFGIRELHFDPSTGFWLNGRNVKIKGAALHGDMGALGVAVPAAAYERRFSELRALGVNAIRTAHNPPSPEFLDVADRMGFLVMDELFDCWTVAKNPFDYNLYFKEWALRDAADTVKRDRNHPSIILWSAGNEIHDTPHPEIAIPILTGLVRTIHENDPTRPVTQALFRPNVSHDYENGLADLLDVIGQNYREQEILAAHAQRPTRRIIGTENTHDRNQWLALRDHPEYSGQFLWVGADYLGESGGWPRIANGAGLLDRTGEPNPRAYEREAWWLEEPSVHMVRSVSSTDRQALDPGYEAVAPRFRQALFRDWNPESMADHTEDVEVYTNADEVDLQLNGKSPGRQKLHSDASPLSWKVPLRCWNDRGHRLCKREAGRD